MKTVGFLLVGVGGQGTLLASNVLAQVGVEAGFDVKKAEVHGMAQRGGSVSSHIRWGEKIFSPLIGRGEADFLIALERLEVLRYLDMLSPGGRALVGDMRIRPLSVSSGSDVYPDDEEVRNLTGPVTESLHLIPSLHLAEEAGNVRSHNVVMLGALSRFIDHVSAEVWLAAIVALAPRRSVEVNQRAFRIGRAALAAG